MRSTLLLILVFMSLTSRAQIANADFEHWNDTIHAPYLTLIGWDQVRSSGTVGGVFGIGRDSPGQQGKYAITISRWYYHDWDGVRQIAPIIHNPDWLSGFYKYTNTHLAGTHTTDTARVQVYMTLWNSALNRRDTIGVGSLDFWESTTYAPFVCPINYLVAGTADTFRIQFSPTKFWSGGCRDSNYCSFLSVDSLNFGKKVISVKSSSWEQPSGPFSLHPNPVFNYAIINNPTETQFSYSVVNNVGQLVGTGNGNARNTFVPAKELPVGLYSIIIVTTSGQNYYLRFLKQ